MKEYIFEDVPMYDYNINQDKPFVEPYLVDGNNNTCVIVCPGGAYSFLAEHEGEAVALWLNSVGISALVLTYRLAPYHYPTQLYDVNRAVKYVRANYQRYGIDKNKVLVMGFSAGGHLAAMAGTYFDDGRKSDDPVEKESSRPDGLILCYPVITLLQNTHLDSAINLTGDENNTQLRQKLSIEKAAHKNMPPLFIWHTFKDTAVPVYNSLALAGAYEKLGLSCSLHIYPNGNHGSGLADFSKYIGKWKDECLLWLEEMGFTN